MVNQSSERACHIEGTCINVYGVYYCGTDPQASRVIGNENEMEFLNEVHKMYWDVTNVQVKENLTLSVVFADGTNGLVRFKHEHLIGVFKPLQNNEFFAKVHIDNGAIAWPGGIDLAPDAMYAVIKEKGEWVLN